MNDVVVYWSQLLQHDFVQNAFIAGGIVAVVAAVMGYFVVLRSQSFAGESLADIGFAGSAGASVLGISALVGMFFLSILAALGMGALGERIRGRDVEVGMVLSFALGLGVLFLSLYTQMGASANASTNVLFGSILSVKRVDVVTSAISCTVTLLVLGLLFRPLLFASIDPEVAQARGVPVRVLSMIFLVLLAVATAEAVLIVGVLLVFALLIAPAAAAEHLTHRPLSALVLSVVLGLVYTWGGLLLAFGGTRWPASFCIATLASLTYFVALVVGRLRPEQRVATQPDCGRYSHPGDHTKV